MGFEARKKTVSRRKRKPPVVYVAVVYSPGGSARSNGSLASWVSPDRTKVTAVALQHKAMWGSHYRVFVGTLTEEVKPLERFTFQAIDTL